MAWLVLGESLSGQTLGAAAISLTGVIITTLPRRAPVGGAGAAKIVR